MGYEPGGGILGVLAAVGLVLLFALGFSWVWLALGLVVRSPRAVMSIGFTLLFPLTFMSNIFVETNTMPSWLEAFAEANPISHLVTAERGLMDGSAAAGEIIWVLANALLTATFASLTISLYRGIR